MTESMLKDLQCCNSLACFRMPSAEWILEWREFSVSSLAFLRLSPLGGESSMLYSWGLLFTKKQWNTFRWLVPTFHRLHVPWVKSHHTYTFDFWLRLAEIRGKAGKGTGLSMPATRFEQIQTTDSCKSMQSRGNHIVMYTISIRIYIYV